MQLPSDRCPDWGCCCDHGRECCAGAVAGGGNYDHLGERGGCRHIDVARIWDFWPQYIAGPRLPCGNWRCRIRGNTRCITCAFANKPVRL